MGDAFFSYGLGLVAMNQAQWEIDWLSFVLGFFTFAVVLCAIGALAVAASGPPPPPSTPPPPPPPPYPYG